MGPPREEIYRAEIFVASRTTANDTRNGGDSVGECLHLGLAKCQLDILAEGKYFLGFPKTFLRPIIAAGKTARDGFGEV
jgi:hypothetical protein